VGTNTVAVSLTNQVSGTLTTTKVNAALNASFGFLNTGSNWTSVANTTMGLADPGKTSVNIPEACYRKHWDPQ